MGEQLDYHVRSLLSRYQYSDLARRDIMNAIGQWNDLKPNLEMFTHTNGSRQELVCLRGTIPVNYKGAQYNIPISIWLSENHPYHPPTCFVTPTSDMQIKASKHVDNQGKVYLPYLHEWRHPQSDMCGLIGIMCIRFGEEPPVFSKPATTHPVYAHSSRHPSQTFEQQDYSSLRSAVEDKMRHKLKNVFEQAHAEMSALRQTQKELNTGKKQLDNILNDIDQETAKVESNIILLKDKNVQIKKVISEMNKKHERVDIDDAVITTAPLYRQLLNMFAEENATEDAIYALSDALRKGIIDIETFLKHVRELSRKQFMLRATMQKCRVKAGLN